MAVAGRGAGARKCSEDNGFMVKKCFYEEGKGKFKDKDEVMKAVVAAIIQLEARLRETENIETDTVMMKSNHVAITSGKAAGTA